jgi:predicted GNAT superfamily acetyltransferase
MADSPAEIEVRHCHSLTEYDECVRLERLTWGEDIIVPAAIFVVAHHSGGQVLAAFADGRMAGFTLALAGLRGKQRFLHSHMTAVLPDFQNRGVGRRLKLFQRHDALQRGIPLVEWTFDPLELKNARFNLTRLGAVVRRYLPDCYGVTNSPLHAGLPTDRLVAEWWLDSERVKGVLADNMPPANAAAQHISLPSNLVEIKMKDREAGMRIQSSARAEFQRWFQEGYVATGIENRGDTTEYILEPRESVAGLHLEEFHEE